MSAQGPYAIARNACRWVRRNPESWLSLLALCESFGCVRPYGPTARLRRGDLYNYAQQVGLSVTLCKEFRFDNNMWSALSRYAIMCRPHLSEVIRPRSCELDGIDMAEVWAVCVGDPSCFAVKDWRQAEAMLA